MIEMGLRKKRQAAIFPNVRHRNKKNPHVRQAEKTSQQKVENILVVLCQLVQHIQDIEPDRGVVVSGGVVINIAAPANNFRDDCGRIQIIVMAERHQKESRGEADDDDPRQQPI